LVFDHTPSIRSFEIPQEMTTMRDGLRWPNRGMLAWMNSFGGDVEIKASKHSCSLEFKTAEQYMAFRFKFDPDVANGLMTFKHFAILEKYWLETAAERAWLSGPRISPVHYQLTYRRTISGPVLWWSLGPELGECRTNTWTMHGIDEMKVHYRCFIGEKRSYYTDVTIILEMINELRTIWVDAPVMLCIPNELSVDKINVTDQDPLFVKLMS
jgi:hypothetical protein